MTEEEWLESANPQEMINYLRDDLTIRKSRLAAGALSRRFWSKPIGTDFERCVDLAERCADGQASEKELLEEFSRLGAGDRYMAHWEAAFIGVLDPIAYPSLPVQEVLTFAKRHLGNEERALILDVFGNPFRPIAVDSSWLTSTVVALAESIYTDRAFDRLPILADAPQDAGCDNPDILIHCRGRGPHVRGCWVVDLLTAKS